MPVPIVVDQTRCVNAARLVRSRRRCVTFVFTPHPHPVTRHHTAVVVCAALVSGAALATTAEAQRTHEHSGITLSVELSRQNIIGGALINGVDVLKQVVRPVASASLGVRYQLPFGSVIGGELGLGRFDGSFRREDAAQALRVNYSSRQQRHWGLLLGHPTSGRDGPTLAFVYLSEVSRDFAVQVQQGSAQFHQQDGQGLLRFGIGAEHAVHRSVSIRATLGTSRADFGSRATNIVPRRPLEASFGATVLAR